MIEPSDFYVEWWRNHPSVLLGELPGQEREGLRLRPPDFPGEDRPRYDTQGSPVPRIPVQPQRGGSAAKSIPAGYQELAE